MSWSRVRRLVQALSFVAFVLLTVGLGARWHWLPVDLPSRLDPLIGLAAVLASREWIVFWAAALGTVVLTLVLGRVWCGWLCPLGTLLDVVPARNRTPRTRISKRWGLGKYATFAIVVGAALLGSLGPMILDPLTILSRPLQELARPYMGTDALGRSVGSSVGSVFTHPIAFISLIPLALVLTLNAIQRRTWCRDLCPLGGMLALLSRVPGIRRTVAETSCTSCGRCSAVCATDAIDRESGYESSSGECTVCMDCIDACPNGANSFVLPRLPRLDLPAYRQDRRDALTIAGAVGVGIGLAMLPKAEAEGEILRPPATNDERLAELCVRCGACYSACPTGALRPSMSFISKGGPWTPMLDERPAHCGLNCNRCARPCPTDAIHTHTTDEIAALGLGEVAAVNKSQCRAWARNHECMLCQRACPISDALVGVERPVDASGRTGVQVPQVVASECIGCGLCMSVCPMMPPAIGVNLPPFQGTGSNRPPMPRP